MKNNFTLSSDQLIKSDDTTKCKFKQTNKLETSILEDHVIVSGLSCGCWHNVKFQQVNNMSQNIPHSSSLLPGIR